MNSTGNLENESTDLQSVKTIVEELWLSLVVYKTVGQTDYQCSYLETNS